jgi:hypothetical protein
MSQPSSLMLLLGIPDLRIVSTRLVREQELVIEVELIQPTIVCHRCGRIINEVDGYDEARRLNYHSLSGQWALYLFAPSAFAVCIAMITRTNF